MFSFSSCFYVQDVLELVTRKEGKEREMGKEMSHFLCQTVVFH